MQQEDSFLTSAMEEPDNAETLYLDIPYDPKAFHFFDEVWVFKVVRKLYPYHLEAYELFLERDNSKADYSVAVRVQVYLLSTSNEESESLIGEGLHLFHDGQGSNMIAVYGKTETSENDRLKIVMRRVSDEEMSDLPTTTQTVTGKSTLNLLDTKWIDDFDGECLSTDFTNLLASQHLSDIDLRVGGEAIPAHKCILAARSDAFREQLTKSTSFLEIDDSNFEAVFILVSYLYSGKLPAVNIDNARELYRLAHKYRVNSLKNTIPVVLVANFLEDNVLETLRLAEDHDDSRLKDRAIDFVIENHVILSHQWKGFSKSNSKLSREVCKEFIERSKDKCVSPENKQSDDAAKKEKKTKKRMWKSIF